MTFLKFRIFLVLLVISACAQKKETSAEWAEMDSFHSIMSECYHPMKDSANLFPAKANAEALATEAEKWAQASLPEKVKTDAVKAMIDKLKSDTRTFADQVKSNTADSVLSASLENLHNEFHEITEAWYGGGSGDEHKHH